MLVNENRRAFISKRGNGPAGKVFTWGRKDTARMALAIGLFPIRGRFPPSPAAPVQTAFQRLKNRAFTGLSA